MQLSKTEDKAYGKLRENNLFLFGIKDLELILGVSKTKAYNIIRALKKKKAIKKAGGFFVFADADEFAVGTRLVHPSYISFWSALNYYGFSDQLPKSIFLASTKYSKGIEKFKYVTLSKKRFFGYVLVNDIVIAEKEKAIIDSLLFPKYSGGIAEVIKSIKSALSLLDIKKLVNYAVSVESKAVLRRMGYILDSLNYKSKDLERIRKKIGKGYELLDPSLSRKNNLNAKWLLDINTK